MYKFSFCSIYIYIYIDIICTYYVSNRYFNAYKDDLVLWYLELEKGPHKLKLVNYLHLVKYNTYLKMINLFIQLYFVVVSTLILYIYIYCVILKEIH